MYIKLGVIKNNQKKFPGEKYVGEFKLLIECGRGQ